MSGKGGQRENAEDWPLTLQLPIRFAPLSTGSKGGGSTDRVAQKGGEEYVLLPVVF